ncbi:MAG: polysaccharide biosynthesis protein [Geobacter sp.]|nr:polysaccharide biosynthesis protein [Geobacter sp.]
MRRFKQVIGLWLLLFFIPALGGAASLSDQETQPDEGVYVGEVKQEFPLGKEMVSDDQLKETRKSGDGWQALKPLKPTVKTSEDAKTDKVPAAKKLRILLRAEPGDSMLTLSWKLKELNVRPGDLPPKFTLYYGIEPGRYEKKLEVGDVSEYKLRFLRNNQLYYLKLQGVIPAPVETTKSVEAADDATQPSELTIFSNEIKATPAPPEELGSPLEKSFAAKTQTLQDKIEAEPFQRSLQQFGYDFFKNSLTAGTALENTPVGPDYVIGPGDSLRIDLWGSIQARQDLVVDRNGEISIPRIGTIKVWGVTFQQAREIIDKAISRYYKGYELNVSMGRLRTIQVFVVGEVESPGTYSVASTATVINALALAGGPAKTGTLRAIRLSRGGSMVQEIDLYAMFLSGDRSKDLRLESGDTIFVPVIGPVAAVAGEVKRPGIYELKEKTTLQQLLQMAGGVTASGDLGRIQLERFEGNASRVVMDFELQNARLDGPAAALEIRDRDLVKIFPVYQALRQVVTLQGNAVRPGEYQFRQGMRISDLLPSYRDLLPQSYLESAQVIRLVPPDFHRESIAVNLKKVWDGDTGENILLHEQDTLKIFSRTEMEEKMSVAINGHVVNPGTYDYYDRMTIRDLLAAAGSLKRNAYMEKAELTRTVTADGVARTTRFDVNLNKALAGDPQNNLTLQPDDVLIVRGIQEWLESDDRFVTVEGEVRFPGTYSIGKGEKLSSVLERAGGYTDKAYLSGARFTRKAVQKEQQKRMDEIILRTEQDILKKQGELASVAASREELEATKSALEGLQKSLEKLKTLKAEGRVVVKLEKLDAFEDSAYNVELQGGDLIQIPPRSNVVNVLGQVYNQTAHIYQPGEQVSYYLEKAGGVTRDGDEKDMYIIRADGSVFSRQQASFGIHWDDASSSWTFGSFMAAALQPGDTLVVPQKLERTAWLRDIKDITQILANVALTAGTVLIGLK